MNAIDRIKAEYQDELKKAEREDAVRAHLPKTNSWKICVHKADTWASAAVNTIEEVRTIADQLQALPLGIKRDGCTDIRPHQDGDTEIGPAVVEFNGHASYQAENVTIRWWTAIGYETVRVSIVIAPIRNLDIGRVQQEYVSGRATHQIEGDVSSARLETPITQITTEEGDLQACAERVSWWRSPGAPGRFTLYFVPTLTGDARPATLGDILENLEARGAES
jgi:hypothetical protein